MRRKRDPFSCHSPHPDITHKCPFSLSVLKLHNFTLLFAISSRSCCFPSFWLWTVVHVNKHSSPSRFINNTHCVLIGESDKRIPQISLAVSGVGGGDTSIKFFFLWTLCWSDTVTLGDCYCDIYVLPMKNTCFCFCERFRHRPRCLVTCLGIMFLSLFLRTICHLRSASSVQTKLDMKCLINHITWLFKTFWW